MNYFTKLTNTHTQKQKCDIKMLNFNDKSTVESIWTQKFAFLIFFC